MRSSPNASGVSRIFLHKQIKYVCCRESYIGCWWSWSTGISMSSWSHLDVICGGICLPNLCVKHDGRLLWSQPMNAPLHKRLDIVFSAYCFLHWKPQGQKRRHYSLLFILFYLPFNQNNHSSPKSICFCKTSIDYRRGAPSRSVIPQLVCWANYYN